MTTPAQQKRVVRLAVAAGSTTPPIFILAGGGTPLVRALPGATGTMTVETSELPESEMFVSAQARGVEGDFSGNDFTRTDGGDFVADGFLADMVVNAQVAVDRGSPAGAGEYRKSVNVVQGRRLVSVSTSVLEFDGSPFTAETGFTFDVINGDLPVVDNAGADGSFSPWGSGAVAVPTVETLPPVVQAVRGIASTADGVIEVEYSE